MASRRVTESISRIPLAWSMAYALRQGRDVTLVDCGLYKDRAALLSGLEELGIAPGDVRTLLLTHAHCDHAGNAAFFAAQGATVIAHHAEARYIAPPRRSYAYRGLDAVRRPFTSLAFTLGEVLYPVERCRVGRAVEDGDTLNVAGGPLRVVHAPGHTPGHIAFYHTEEGILFSGDAVLNIIPNLIPIKREVGLSLPLRLLSDDWTQANASARRLADLAPRLLLAGHGPPLSENTAARLRAWADLLPYS